MMARHSAMHATGAVSIFGAAGPALDEIGLSAWIVQAEPGETLVYHRGFLAVDTFGSAPSRGRGSKQTRSDLIIQPAVAPLVRAPR